MTTLVIEFKKIESADATKYVTFYSNSKAETIVNESDIDDASILRLYQTYKKNLEKVQVGLLIQS